MRCGVLESKFHFCKVAFFGDLSSSRFFVFRELQQVLIQQFGDLTCGNEGWFRSISALSIVARSAGCSERFRVIDYQPLQLRHDLNFSAPSFPLTTNLECNQKPSQ